jgi:hypothetical protein
MIPLVLAVSTRLQSTLTDVPDNSEGVVEQAQDAETESEEEQETQPSKRNRDGAVFQEVLDGITVSGTSSAAEHRHSRRLVVAPAWQKRFLRRSIKDLMHLEPRW